MVNSFEFYFIASKYVSLCLVNLGRLNGYSTLANLGIEVVSFQVIRKRQLIVMQIWGKKIATSAVRSAMHVTVNPHEIGKRGSLVCEVNEDEAKIPDRAPNEIGTYPIDFKPPML
jgi:hypothetical protein